MDTDEKWDHVLSQRIHGTGIFAYIYHHNQLNLGKYTSPMDPIGFLESFCHCSIVFYWNRRCHAGKNGGYFSAQAC